MFPGRHKKQLSHCKSLENLESSGTNRYYEWTYGTEVMGEGWLKEMMMIDR